MGVHGSRDTGTPTSRRGCIWVKQSTLIEGCTSGVLKVMTFGSGVHVEEDSECV